MNKKRITGRREGEIVKILYKCKRCGGENTEPNRKCQWCGGEVEISDFESAFDKVSHQHQRLLTLYHEQESEFKNQITHFEQKNELCKFKYKMIKSFSMFSIAIMFLICLVILFLR